MAGLPKNGKSTQFAQQFVTAVQIVLFGACDASSAQPSQQSPPPTRSPDPPTEQISDDSTFNIRQLNANGIGNKLTELGVGLRQTYVNLKKANWDRSRQEIEATLSKRSPPTDCQYTVLLKAASHHIPTGRHRLHEEPVPAEILDVMNRRDDLRKIDPTSPELPRLNKAIQNRISVHKRQK